MHTDAAIQVEWNKIGQCREGRGRKVEIKFLEFEQSFGEKYVDVKVPWEGEGERRRQK